MKPLFGFLMLMSFHSIAQQNFFNVPSSDITPKNKVFFQQQVNLSKEALQSSTTLSYGLGREWEIGVNALGITYDEAKHDLLFNNDNTPYAPLFAANFQKKFHLDNHLSISAGTQIGCNEKGKGAAYIYANSVYNIEKTHTKLVGGLYTSSNGFFGSETRNWMDKSFVRYAGIQAGMEQHIWKEKLLFQADFISGKHDLGELVLGGAYAVAKSWIVSAGYQIPTFHSHSVKAVVLELTYSHS